MRKINIRYAWNKIFGNLLSTAENIEVVCGRKKAASIVDMLWCTLRYGAHTKDYFMFEFYKKNGWERNSYLTIIRYFRLVDMLNKALPQRSKLENKAFQHEMFHDFIRRDWMLLNKDTPSKKVYEFLEQHGGVGIVKPVNGEQGHGVGKVNKNENVKIDTLIREAHTNDFIIEELLVNIEELAVLNPSSLNIIRVYTLTDKIGNVHILEMMLRVGNGDAGVDNWGSGGVGYHIDKESGIIDQYGLDKKSGKYLRHPSSGTVMLGFRIPRLQELLEYVNKLAKVEPRARFVGWDIAVLPDRFELVEMNCPGGHDFLQAFGKGYYRVIKSNW